jgi:hypothetical protein
MKKRLILMSAIIFTTFFLLPHFVFSYEKVWTRALPGETIAGPVAYGDRVYIVGGDRTVTCLSETGVFLWSKKIPGKPLPFLTVTGEGTVYSLSAPGTLTAMNPDGSHLWQLNGKEPPLFPPFEGRDGRFFLVYSNKIVCVTHLGALKWTLPIDAYPVFHLSETGDGDLLLVCNGGILYRISPFGALLEKNAASGEPQACAPIPGGFVFGDATGLVKAFDVRSKSELIWQFRGQSACRALFPGDGTLLSLHADGTMYGLNVTDGSLLWHKFLGKQVGESPFLSYEYGQFNLAFPGFAGAITAGGIESIQAVLPENIQFPFFSSSGIVYATTSDWLIYGYHVETRIKTENNRQKRENYGILYGISQENSMGFLNDTQSMQDYFSRISEDLNGGTVGTNEPLYARQLTEILENHGGAFDRRTFTVVDRSRAAILLGQLGSSEYRGVLIDQAYRQYDSSLAIGILFGLASLSHDWDGQSLQAVRHLVRSAGSRETAVLFAACDALYSLIRYSGGQVALEGTAQLLAFLESPYERQVQEYARKKLENILD